MTCIFPACQTGIAALDACSSTARVSSWTRAASMRSDFSTANISTLNCAVSDLHFPGMPDRYCGSRCVLFNRTCQLLDSSGIDAIRFLDGKHLDIELCGCPRQKSLEGFPCFRSGSRQVTQTRVLKMRSIENRDGCSFSRQTNRHQSRMGHGLLN